LLLLCLHTSVEWVSAGFHRQQTNEQLQKIGCRQSLLCFQVVLLLTLFCFFPLQFFKYPSVEYMSSLELDFMSSSSVRSSAFSIEMSCGGTCMAY